MQERVGLTTSDWLLVKTPIPIILLFFSYLYFVLRCGPKFMKDRKPYKLNTFIRFYNIFQMVSNALIVYHIVDMGFHKLYIFNCIEPTYEDGSLSPRSDQLEYYILIVKIIDFTETFLFVLRKKQRQISFLHLYHHISTIFIFWYSMKYFIAGSTLTFSLYNSSVHVIMYTYYFLASFGPSMQKLLNPIKPIITTIQMVQFIILASYILQAFILDCTISRPSAVLLLGNIAMNFILFYNFYRTNYKKQTKAK
ncbi:PREDICTED: elongation of very long chain fatty acids protein 7-like [Eufriesea mexicana]|uniref:elongation of very long chain fatty acids protein 7-like n=1 Tax=Eufriesea mexicana TaxID=516756 RepID=UPI00083C6637|nr:PREDICTED: elongation of very long chain fatty acids protein 7-like [Eufriesea mexicana]